MQYIIIKQNTTQANNQTAYKYIHIFFQSYILHEII